MFYINISQLCRKVFKGAFETDFDCSYNWIFMFKETADGSTFPIATTAFRGVHLKTFAVERYAPWYDGLKIH